MTPEQERVIRELEDFGFFTEISEIDDGKDNLIIRFEGIAVIVIHADGTYTVPDDDTFDAKEQVNESL